MGSPTCRHNTQSSGYIHPLVVVSVMASLGLPTNTNNFERDKQVEVDSNYEGGYVDVKYFPWLENAEQTDMCIQRKVDS